MNMPINLKIALDNENTMFTHAFFRQTIKISELDEESSTWSEMPTYGFLNHMPACVNGPLCPVTVKSGEITMTLDLSSYKLWLLSLQNDVPYQFEIMMTDMV
ncbi:hypothetical protein PENTCL1PPCAC_17127, partial [Pristionchus entomophagus]